MNATYYESTKTLTITSPCCDVPRGEPVTRISVRVPTRHHLKDTLYHRRLKLDKKHWKRHGELYTAILKWA